VDGEEAEGGGGGDAEEVDGGDEVVGVLKAGEAGSCPGEGQAGAEGEATCEHGEQEEKQAAFVHVDEAAREGQGRIDGSEKERGENISLKTEMAEGESAAVIRPTRLPASRVASSYRCNRCEPGILVEPSTTPSSSLSISVSRIRGSRIENRLSKQYKPGWLES
jgi:hypothetical protein